MPLHGKHRTVIRSFGGGRRNEGVARGSWTSFFHPSIFRGNKLSATAGGLAHLVRNRVIIIQLETLKLCGSRSCRSLALAARSLVFRANVERVALHQSHALQHSHNCGLMETKKLDDRARSIEFRGSTPPSAPTFQRTFSHFSAHIVGKLGPHRSPKSHRPRKSGAL